MPAAACSTPPRAFETLPDAEADVIGIGLGGGQLRPRLVERHLVVARINDDEDRARLDLLVLLHGHVGHRSANARRYRSHVRVYLRIIGRLAPGGRPQPGGRRQHSDQDRANRKANPCLHQFTPPR
jgi:hypothetical protein